MENNRERLGGESRCHRDMGFPFQIDEIVEVGDRNIQKWRRDFCEVRKRTDGFELIVSLSAADHITLRANLERAV
jgi:hypothetical protein